MNFEKESPAFRHGENVNKDKVKNIMEKGTAWALGLAGVEPSGKLTTTWGTFKTQHFNKNNK